MVTNMGRRRKVEADPESESDFGGEPEIEEEEEEQQQQVPEDDDSENTESDPEMRTRLRRRSSRSSATAFEDEGEDDEVEVPEEDDEEDDEDEELGARGRPRRSRVRSSRALDSGAIDNEDDEPAYEPPLSVEAPRKTGKRGRPPGSKNKSTLAKELAASRREGSYMSSGGNTPGSHTPRAGGGGGGGGARGRGGRTGAASNVGHSLAEEVENDEYKLPEDAAGEIKVSKIGELLGGREYRVRTFTITSKGPQLYMLGTEPARCMGFRDAYLLFQKHRRLLKVVLTDAEKHDLIEREVIPHSYKGRTIAVVTARSVFREFGAKIVVGGKRVFDDYYERQAREQGYVPGELADPDDKLPPPGEPYNKNQYVAWLGATSIYHQYGTGAGGSSGGGAGTGSGGAGGPGGAGQGGQAVRANAIGLSGYATPTIKRPSVNALLTDENWLFIHSQASSVYNSELTKRRKRERAAGIYEPHTAVTFMPRATQPTRAKWTRIQETNPTHGIEIEAVFRGPSAPVTGLKSVDPSIFADCVSEEIRAAIELQQNMERLA